MKLSLAFLVAVALSGVANAGPISSPALADDIGEFVALLPQEEMTKLFVKYLGEDAELQAAFTYGTSEEFRNLLIEMESIEEVMNFYDYLAGSGFDMYGMINKVNEAIGVPDLAPREPATTMKLTGGVRGLFKDMKAILPIDKIKALYHKKINTSPAFAYFVEHLESPAMQKTINLMYANDDYRRIIGQWEAHGIPIGVMTNFIGSIFGMSIPSSYLLETANDEVYQSISPRSALDNDLQEFVKLLPAKAIRRIATKHYIFDSKFRRAIKYIRSEQFYKLVRKLHEIPEYNELLAMLEALGLNVQSVIRKIHDAIKFPGRLLSASEIEQRSVATFIAEVKAALPINQIKALYKHKLETSADFQKLVEVISSDKFQAVTNALFADPAFQDFLHKAQSNGVNLRAVSDFFLAVFGITTPPGIIDF